MTRLFYILILHDVFKWVVIVAKLIRNLNWDYFWNKGLGEVKKNGEGWEGKFFRFQKLKRIFLQIFFLGRDLYSTAKCIAQKQNKNFIRLHSFCVNYLITIQIQSGIKLECCVHTCPNCSWVDLSGRKKMRPAEHLVGWCSWPLG